MEHDITCILYKRPPEKRERSQETFIMHVNLSEEVGEFPKVPLSGRLLLTTFLHMNPFIIRLPTSIQISSQCFSSVIQVELNTCVIIDISDFC